VAFDVSYTPKGELISALLVATGLSAAANFNWEKEFASADNSRSLRYES
jgi:hypothetical protein